MAATTAQVDTSFDAAAQLEPLQVTLAGEQFTVVNEPPAGAIVVFSRRMQQDIQQQLGAVLELLEKWIVADDHVRLYDMVGSLSTEQLQPFLDKDLAEAIQAVAARPT